MTNKEIFEEKMNDLADAINEKAGTTGAKDLDELAEAVRNIPTGGGAKKYMHNIFVNDKLQNIIVLSFLFVSDDATPYTKLDDVCQYLISHFAANSFIFATGGGRVVVSTTNTTYDMIVTGLKRTPTNQIDVWGAEINMSSNSVSKTTLIGNIGVYTTAVIDTVTEL